MIKKDLIEEFKKWYMEYISQSIPESKVMRKLKPKEEMKKEKEEVYIINTSKCEIKVPKDCIKFNAEEFEYDQTKYPEWAQNLSKLYPTLKNVEIKEICSESWLLLNLQDEYYGTPEYLIVNRKEEQEEDPMFKKYNIGFFQRIDFNNYGFIGESVPNQMMEIIQSRMREDYYNSMFTDGINRYAEMYGIQRINPNPVNNEEVVDTAEEPVVVNNGIRDQIVNNFIQQPTGNLSRAYFENIIINTNSIQNAEDGTQETQETPKYLYQDAIINGQTIKNRVSTRIPINGYETRYSTTSEDNQSGILLGNGR